MMQLEEMEQSFSNCTHGDYRHTFALASMFGHAKFVTEYIRLSSISAHQLSQLNQDGYNPLHLASANDHLEIVQFLLEFGKHKSVVEELCMKKIETGELRFIRPWLLEVLVFLIDQKLGSSVQDLLNRGDHEGNTIMHLATAKNNFKFVLLKKIISFPVR
ncbi:UNVERIFIED_CONTAM: hypothetical protein Sradi_0883000 [Sesamum radiatum]|uniref:Uncharacterized protein n=1 Tax=Sesamum radiatum TaxID=300843 RepID=A0AAW2V4Y8_SESRA